MSSYTYPRNPRDNCFVAVDVLLYGFVALNAGLLLCPLTDTWPISHVVFLSSSGRVFQHANSLEYRSGRWHAVGYMDR